MVFKKQKSKLRSTIYYTFIKKNYFNRKNNMNVSYIHKILKIGYIKFRVYLRTQKSYKIKLYSAKQTQSELSIHNLFQCFIFRIALF